MPKYIPRAKFTNPVWRMQGMNWKITYFKNHYRIPLTRLLVCGWSIQSTNNNLKTAYHMELIPVIRTWQSTFSCLPQLNVTTCHYSLLSDEKFCIVIDQACVPSCYLEVDWRIHNLQVLPISIFRHCVKMWHVALRWSHYRLLCLHRRRRWEHATRKRVELLCLLRYFCLLCARLAIFIVELQQPFPSSWRRGEWI